MCPRGMSGLRQALGCNRLSRGESQYATAGKRYIVNYECSLFCASVSHWRRMPADGVWRGKQAGRVWSAAFCPSPFHQNPMA